MRILTIASLSLILACSTSQEGGDAAQSGAKGGNPPQVGGKAPAADGAAGMPESGQGNAHGAPDGHHTGPIEFAPAPGNATVDFGAPLDGATVSSPVQMVFKIEGMTVAPADGAVLANQGHHHVIVDGKSVDEASEVPKNETHIHYGKGQVEAPLELSPGPHTLTLQFADGRHRSFGSRLSKTINITVEGEVVEEAAETVENPQGGAPAAPAGGATE